MASLSTDAAGNSRILFKDGNGDRKKIWLGDTSAKSAGKIKDRVEELVEARCNQTGLHSDTLRWLTDISDELHKKLSAVGLVASRQQITGGAATLAAFVDAYIKQRADVKGSTAITYCNTRRNLVDHFGERKPLATITEGDADGFRLYLLTLVKKRKAKPKNSKSGSTVEPAESKPGKKLAMNTVNKRCQIAKQIFKAAVRQKLIRSNPFADQKGATIRANRERDHFITTADAEALDVACPDAQWRLIVALSRFGGLRCPSEHLALTWDCIDWDRKRMTVLSPKTEHRPGGESRVIPIFPEVEKALNEVWGLPGAADKFVITRYRDAGTNLRTQFLKIIRRAGLKPWPRLFHNMRASRQTELMQSFPIHVVCEWLGNSKLIAQEHYLRVNDADFDKATDASPVFGAPIGAHSDQIGAQASADETEDNEKTPENAAFSGESRVDQWSLLDSNQ